MNRTLSRAGAQLLDDLLQPLLELAAVLRAGHERADVEGEHALAGERLGNVAVHDPLRQPLDDGRLADARLADERGIVLRPPAEDLDDALDLLLAPDDRVEGAGARRIGEVDAQLVEGRRLRRALRLLRRRRAARLAEDVDDLVADLVEVDAQALEHAGGDALALADEAEEEVLGADVVVAEAPGLVDGELDHPLGARGQAHLADDRSVAATDDELDRGPHLGQLDVHVLEHARRHALALADEAEEEVLGPDVVVVEALRLVLGEGQHLPRSIGELVESVHGSCSWYGCSECTAPMACAASARASVVVRRSNTVDGTNSLIVPGGMASLLADRLACRHDASHRTHRQHPQAGFAAQCDAGSRRRRRVVLPAGRSVRRGRGGHARAHEGDRLPRRHRWRAAQAELRHLPDRRPRHARTGRCDDPVRGRAHSPAPGPHGRAVPLRDERLVVPRRRAAAHRRPAQAGRHLRLGAQPPLSRRWDRRLPARAFIEDLVAEATAELRGCLDRGAIVQIDFTEARLSLKLDPSGGLLSSFVDLNNRVLEGLSDADRRRVGVHTCPGGDQDSTHSADVDYAELLPTLFRMNVGNFYVQLASETDRPAVLRILGEQATGDRRIFVGVIDPIDPRIETPDEVSERILEAARFIDPAHLGTTDDCGFSPFGDDTSTSRDTAFAKIEARVLGTAMASEALGV